jgi:hypothetical protein
MTMIDAANINLTTGRSLKNPGAAKILQSDQKVPADLFDPAEFLDRIACREYRGSIADVVDRLSDEQRLAAALLLAERIEASRRQRRAAQPIARSAAA